MGLGVSMKPSVENVATVKAFSAPACGQFPHSFQAHSRLRTGQTGRDIP